MKHFVRANALKSLAGNLVANTVIAGLLLRNEPFIYLPGPTPHLLSMLLPTVVFSVLRTTLITFAILTAARKNGQVLPALLAKTSWVARALQAGVRLSLLFGVAALALLPGPVLGHHRPIAKAAGHPAVVFLLAGVAGRH